MISEIFAEIKDLSGYSIPDDGGDGIGAEIGNGSCLLRGSFYWDLEKEKYKKKQVKENDKKEKDIRNEKDNIESKVGYKFKNIDFRAEKGSLTMIIGKIGSGKSSLIQALLGEMKVDSSPSSKPVRVLKGSVAYLGQKPWIMNATVKENILLGREYKEEFFEKCLRYSALKEDLTHWKRGIDHIVGKQGVALSGGQKVRLALARCLYQDADIYLIDDVTSALDVHVGTMVFNMTIKEFLGNKTVVMATHNIQFISQSDYVYYMDQGEISAKGTFEAIQSTELFKAFKNQREVLNLKSEEAKKEVQTQSTKNENNKQEGQKKGSEKKPTKKAAKKFVLPKKQVSESNLVDYFLTPSEDIKKQKISPETYINMMKQILGKQFIVMFAIVIIKTILENQKNVRLNSWANRFTELSSLKCFLTYNFISVASQVLNSGILLANEYTSSKQSAKISSQMLYRVLHSNLEKFADKVPTSTFKSKLWRSWSLGYICSTWRYIIDHGAAALILILNLYSQIGPLFLACLAVLGLHTVLGNRAKTQFTFYHAANYRIPRRARENYYSAVKEGLIPLKAMKLHGYLRKKFYCAAEKHENYGLLNCLVESHKSLETDLVHLIFFVIPSYMLFTFLSGGVGYQEIMVALFVQSLESLKTEIYWVLKTISYVETALRSFEMCLWFNFVDPEKNLKTFEEDYNRYTDINKKTLDQIQADFGKVGEKGLVNKGTIEVKGLSAKYSVHDKLVLKDLNFKVQAGEKIGIVGRTGSGKSSLIKLFWRYLEPVEGSILVDGVDLSKADLKSFRRKISVVTQETSLLYGTLRENIDPLGTLKDHDEEHLIEYLKNLGFVNKEFLKRGLNMRIEGSGTNLSMGERQMIALARILLKPQKLVILDEATSSMDIKTEEFVQSEIQKKLGDSTMLIVAHRLQTVMNCDRILVLENGEMVVFDSVPTLMSNLEKLKKGELVEGAEGVKFFGEAIEQITKTK